MKDDFTFGPGITDDSVQWKNIKETFSIKDDQIVTVRSGSLIGKISIEDCAHRFREAGIMIGVWWNADLIDDNYRFTIAALANTLLTNPIWVNRVGYFITKEDANRLRESAKEHE